MRGKLLGMPGWFPFCLDTAVKGEGGTMLELKGKYNEAKIFTDVVDESSISQVMLLLNQEFAAGSRIRLMPDIHAGAGCTLGLL